ncbi:hypothetical protein MesoLjLb_45470 [Mesorhizobium sp. L-8-3]|nr:hypothetical protein MesoLjLb_45470 [Mesorhizobium sp. L-8-3]
MYVADTGCARQALQRVVPMELVVDLLLHAFQPRRWCAPRFETRTLEEFREECDKRMRNRGRRQIVCQFHLPAQLKGEPVWRRPTCRVQELDIKGGVARVPEQRRVDSRRQAVAAFVRDVSGICLAGRKEDE